MAQKFDAIIFVEPRGKGRPRVVKRGSKVWAYTPSGTARTEILIRETLMKEGRSFPPGVPLKLRVIFYRDRPKSLPKKVKYPVTRPDLDQYVKLILDACQKYIYPDDAAIVSLEAHKRFGSPPRIVLVLEELGDEEATADDAILSVSRLP